MEQFEAFITKTATKMFYKHQYKINNTRMTKGDYISCAAIGVAMAMKNYDPRKGKKLEAYARGYIRSEIHKEITRSFDNNNNEVFGDHIFDGVHGYRHKWPKFMCFSQILESVGHVLSDLERDILHEKFCNNLSDYKIAKKKGRPLRLIQKLARISMDKIKDEVLKSGDVHDIYDIRNGLGELYSKYLCRKAIGNVNIEFNMQRKRLRIVQGN